MSEDVDPKLIAKALRFLATGFEMAAESGVQAHLERIDDGGPSPFAAGLPKNVRVTCNEDMLEIDRWAMARYASVAARMVEAYDNYAYPTSADLKPGAFDIEEFGVFDAGDQIVFRVRTRDLTPTFGSPLGAQLVDVYVHVPGAAQTSTAASFPQRNYAIADAGAWSRLIEVQGFGQRYVDAGGATLGNVSIRGNAISRYITFSVPEASLGTPGPGWGFTIVLTGQDGFSPDQARCFARRRSRSSSGSARAPARIRTAPWTRAASQRQSTS